MQGLRLLKGQTYILGIELNKDLKIAIGRLGNISFSRGIYFYIGSAKNRLSARLRRHLSPDKRLFWHIDYLLSSEASCLKKIWTGNNKRECSIVRLIYQSLKSRIIKGFGSSDCHCPGHLVFIRRPKKGAGFFDKDSPLSKFFKKQGFSEVRLNYAG